MNYRNQVVMLRELENNSNPDVYKKLIKNIAKQVQERVYWFNTAQGEGEFLQQYWEKQACTDQVLKKRLGQITEEKLAQLFTEVNQGKIQNNSELDINVLTNLKVKQMAEDVAIYDPTYFSQKHPKTKQAKQKIKSIQEDFHKFKTKMNKLKEKEMMKKIEDSNLRQKAKESLEKQKKEKYHEQVLKTIQQTEKNKEERENKNKKFKEFLKEYKKTKPLHHIMEQQYKNKFELPMLEQNKRKLEQFTAKTKPTLEEINEHERNYLEEKESRTSRVLIGHHTIDVSFKSKFYLEEQKKLLEGDDENETLFDQMEKKKRYSEMVKNSYKPAISTKLRQSIAQSALKASFAKQSPDRSIVVQKGKLYLQYMRSLEKNRKHSSPSESRTPEPSLYQSRYVNYLEQFKHEHDANQHSRMSHNWEKQLKNQKIPEWQRRQRIILKSKLLQEKAKRQEQFVNNSKYDKAEQILQKKREIDETMIDVIRAKVAVLKNAQQS